MHVVCFIYRPSQVEHKLEVNQMKIPNSVIYTVGDVLGSWYYSHTRLNTLFGGNGFPGDPPAGNCIQKCQEWMKRANDSIGVDPIELLGLVLVEFMNLNLKDNSVWNDGFHRVSEVLAKNGLSFELNGNIVSINPNRSSGPALSSVSFVSRKPTYTRLLQETVPDSSGATNNYPVIVLVTVNDNETQALLDEFLGENKTPRQIIVGGVTYNELGLHGGHRIINTICEMGAVGIGASQQRTRQAIDHWSPCAIIAVGIAFGIDENKQNIGNVLVSTQIQDYELGRLNMDGILTPRGDKPSSADILKNSLRQTDLREQRCQSDWPKVSFGLVLSGQKLVDNIDYRESLKALFPEAIGGEMEGVGLYVSASESKVDWIVVKAICDWGHKKNQVDKDAWQRLAAKNAVRVLKSTLDFGSLYKLEVTHPMGSHVKSTLLGSKAPGNLSSSFPEEHIRLKLGRDNYSFTDVRKLLTKGVLIEKIISDLLAIDFHTIPGVPAHDIGTLQQWQPILQNNLDGWGIVIKGNKEIVGYWHFLALKEIVYKQALDGLIHDGELTLDSVELLIRPGKYHFFFINVAVLLEHRCVAVNRLLYEGFCERLLCFAKQGIFAEDIAANAYTTEGLALCKHLNMEYVKHHHDHGEIYKMHMVPFPNCFEGREDLKNLYRMFGNQSIA